MMQIKCEMCGSPDLVKEDSLYVCKHCGMKYSSEEAKKMMVEIEGAVKIDDTEELANLYVLARRAKDADDGKNALKYYDMILIKDPDSWEAVFYTSMNGSLDLIKKKLPTVVRLVKDMVAGEEKQKDIFIEVANRVSTAAEVFFGSGRFMDSKDAVDLAYEFSRLLINAYPNKEHIEAEIICIKKGLFLQSKWFNMYPSMAGTSDLKAFADCVQYVKENDPLYEMPAIPNVIHYQKQFNPAWEFPNAFVAEKSPVEKNEKEKRIKTSEKATILGCLFGTAIFIAIVGWIISSLGNLFN